MNLFKRHLVSVLTELVTTYDNLDILTGCLYTDMGYEQPLNHTYLQNKVQ